MLKIEKSGIIVINKKGDILLVKGKVKWSFPKGGIEKGETLKQCALREFREETGMVFKQKLNPYHTFRYINCIYFVVNISTNNLPKTGEKPDPTEIVDVRWVNPEKIQFLDMNAALRLYYDTRICDVSSGKENHIPKRNIPRPHPLIPPGFENHIPKRNVPQYRDKYDWSIIGKLRCAT